MRIATQHIGIKSLNTTIHAKDLGRNHGSLFPVFVGDLIHELASAHSARLRRTRFWAGLHRGQNLGSILDHHRLRFFLILSDHLHLLNFYLFHPGGDEKKLIIARPILHTYINERNQVKQQRKKEAERKDSRQNLADTTRTPRPLEQNPGNGLLVMI